MCNVSYTERGYTSLARIQQLICQYGQALGSCSRKHEDELPTRSTSAGVTRSVQLYAQISLAATRRDTLSGNFGQPSRGQCGTLSSYPDRSGFQSHDGGLRGYFSRGWCEFCDSGGIQFWNLNDRQRRVQFVSAPKSGCNAHSKCYVQPVSDISNG